MYGKNRTNFTRISLVLSARRPNSETLAVIWRLQMPIMSREFVLVVLMKKIVLCGFAALYLINDISMNVLKLNCLISNSKKKFCLICKCSFLIVFVIFSFRLPVHIRVVICKFNNKRVVGPNEFLT